MLKINQLGKRSYNIVAPAGIRFMSDWVDYNFQEFPGRCIINKTIPGCGYTEWCIRNNQNVILCSPRKMLLENKKEQHNDEVFLVVNEFDKDPGVDRKTSNSPGRGDGIIAEKEMREEDTPDTEEIIKEKEIIYQRIYDQYLEYSTRRGQLPHKILVTYDSYHIVKKILQFLGTFDTFYTVVDEFQAILTDSRFKSSAELEFMRVLRDVPGVHFVSATPMLEKYIQMLDDFKDLPYYKIDWTKEDPLRVIKPDLKVLVMKSIGEVLPEIIQTYKDGKFKKIDYDGKEVVSDEAVFYLNSVNHIISIVKRCGLQPSECNILCSKTIDNEKKIRRKLGRKWSIGSVPLKGEKPKMFTFCTRTVYLGADFYSTCGRSFIFGDSNSDCLSIDISQDLPQILGRQRLSENPWKNSATFYFKSTSDWRKMKKEDFDKVLQEKIEETERLLKGYQNNLRDPDPKVAVSLANVYRERAKTNVYKGDYVAVNTKVGFNPTPVFNNYVHVADIRAFDIQQVDYADRFSVFNELYSTFDTVSAGILRDSIGRYESLGGNISARIRFICDLGPDIRELFLGSLNNSDYAKSYYLQLGAGRCKALGYNVSRIRQELGIIKFDTTVLEKEIYSNFKENTSIKKADAKELLKKIYDKVGYKSSPKTTDLEEWFETKTTSIRVGEKVVSGIKLIKKK